MKPSAFFLLTALLFVLTFGACSSPAVDAVLIGDTVALGGFAGSDALDEAGIYAELGDNTDAVLDRVFYDELKMEDWYEKFVRPFFDTEAGALKRLAVKQAGAGEKTPIFLTTTPGSELSLINPEEAKSEVKAKQLFIWLAIPLICTTVDVDAALAGYQNQLMSWIDQYATGNGRVVILTSLRPTAWTQKPVAEAKRNFLGTAKSCAGLRKPNLYFQLPKSGRSTQFLVPPTYGYCAKVFDGQVAGAGTYRSAEWAMLKKLKRKLAAEKPDLKVATVRTPKVKAGHIGPDCFHLTDTGHGKIFRSVRKRL